MKKMPDSPDQNQPNSAKRPGNGYAILVKGRSRKVALIGVYAAAYVAIVEFLPFISYGQLNVRAADFLRGLLPFFPNELVLANGLATFLSDTTSPFGYLDFVGSSIVILFSTYIATRLFRYSILGGFTVHSIILASWLTTLISYSAGIPWLVLAPWIYGGNVLSDIIFPYVLFQALKRRLVYPGRGAPVSS